MLNIKLKQCPVQLRIIAKIMNYFRSTCSEILSTWKFFVISPEAFSLAYLGNSLSLASDAFAVLSHFVSMIIGLVGVRFSRIRWHKANTYGFSRADVLGAFGNSVFATALMLSVFIEAIKRYLNPQKTEKALLVLVVGLVGLFFNVLNYVIFMDCCYCRAPQGDTETGK
uniref:Cation efflux protein transmembrane domain-containing protein n=1 Tax=Apteryx owenii TaxID=8824 RepID=A0A8B9S7Y3_APTOW